MASNIDIIPTIQGATDYICNRLDTLTTVTAAAALIAHTPEDTDIWRDAHDTLQRHI